MCAVIHLPVPVRTRSRFILCGILRSLLPSHWNSFWPPLITETWLNRPMTSADFRLVRLEPTGVSRILRPTAFIGRALPRSGFDINKRDISDEA